tara:strand:+ start:294 stop:470 length:177 start_codon:yes stop_codon:yes gene_type:complete
MLSSDELINIILTEAVEENARYDGRTFYNSGAPNGDLPPIRYGLELIEMPDGRCYWLD